MTVCMLIIITVTNNLHYCIDHTVKI